MDLISHRKDILLIVSSTNPASLDESIIRPGRLIDQFIYVNKPDTKDRLEIF